MFTQLPFGILALLMSTLNSKHSFGVPAIADMPTSSFDFWIKNISPRCAISLIYYKITDRFTFNSIHNIPVMLVPLKYYRTRSGQLLYSKNHKFYNSSARLIKAECYFSILNYKLRNNFAKTVQDDLFLYRLVQYIVGFGFPAYKLEHTNFDSNSTYCLILYHGIERNDEDLRFEALIQEKMEMNLALVYLSKASKRGYNVYCRTPFLKFQVAAFNATNELNSIIDQKFMVTCSSTYEFVALNEHNYDGDYHHNHSVYDHEVITSLLLKANLSICERRAKNCRYFTGSPRVIVSDLGLKRMQTLLVVPTFDNSVRFFTCYTRPVLSFYFYVSAFEIQVWIGITFSGVLLAAFLKLHIYHNLSKAIHFSTLLFYFSIFTEESFSIPSVIDKSRVYRIATILWLLTSLVLTNCYISHVISGLNAPLMGEKLGNENLYGNLSSEIEFNYFSDYAFDVMKVQLRPSQFFNGYLKSSLKELHSTTSNDGYKILSEPVRLLVPKDVWLHVRNPFIYSAFYDGVLQIVRCYTKHFPQNSTFCQTLIRLMRPSNKFYPQEHTYKRHWNYSEYPKGAVEEELINCQKSVYMEKSDQLEYHYMSENYRKKRFYYLQDRFDSTPKNWGFYNLQKSKLPFYFSILIHSGIFHELHKLKLFKDHHKRRSMTSEIIERTSNREVLDLNSSVQTVFILFATMTLLAKLAFVVEFCYSACNKESIFLWRIKLAKLLLDSKSVRFTLNKMTGC